MPTTIPLSATVLFAMARTPCACRPQDVQKIKRAELRSWIEARRAVLSGVKRD